MDKNQLFLCNFIGEDCEENSHEKCAENYEGYGIRATCVCGCHLENKKLVTARSKPAEQGWQSRLDVGESDVSKHKRK